MHPICSVSLRTITNIYLNEIFIFTTEFSFLSHNSSDEHLGHRYYMGFNEIKLLSFLKILPELLKRHPLVLQDQRLGAFCQQERAFLRTKPRRGRQSREAARETQTRSSAGGNPNLSPALSDASTSPASQLCE